MNVIMLAIGALLLYVAVKKGCEPLLLVPIGFGCIMTNLSLNIGSETGFLGLIYDLGIKTGLLPIIIFIGIGAMTDFGPLISRPISGLLGIAAQIGIFIAMMLCCQTGKICSMLAFSTKEAASIGIIGGADGPTTIFLCSQLAPNLLASVAVIGYSYMALIPIIQPPIMRLLTTKKERAIRMESEPPNKRAVIIFPIAITITTGAVIPDALPLIGALMFGNFVKESRVADRLLKTMQGGMINTSTILIGLAVGGRMTASVILNWRTIIIIIMGIIAFATATSGGILMAKAINIFLKKKINPLIGAAGVSAVPMAARVAHNLGQETDKGNYLLMKAMGPNVSGVIGSAIAAGILLRWLS